jgi:hypothetical protein
MKAVIFNSFLQRITQNINNEKFQVLFMDHTGISRPES